MNDRRVFTMRAGVMVRGAAKRALLMAAPLDVDVRVEESKGLFDSFYRFVASGPADSLDRYQRAFNDFAARFGTDFDGSYALSGYQDARAASLREPLTTEEK